MATVAYPFASYCVYSRPCTYVRTTSPPWPITGTAVPRASWSPDIGTTQGDDAEGWTRFTGIEGLASTGMSASMAPAVGSTIDFWFTARSGFARDIQSLSGFWSGLVATPSLSFAPEAQRFHLRFVSTAATPLRIRSTKVTAGTEEFEVADDMTYKVTLPLAAQVASAPAPAPETYANEHHQTRGSRGRFVRR
jgi:hypothetical protein